MRYSPDTRRFSGSVTDVANHVRCTYLTQRAREHAVALVEGRVARDDGDSLIARKGREFEASVVAERAEAVRAAGGRIVDIREAASDRRTQTTLLAECLRDGIELICQAPLRAGSMFGYADLLQRMPDGRYEPIEIKYGRSLRPSFVLQVCAYADALASLQGGVEPEHVRVVTGDRTEHVLSTRDHIEYLRAVRARFDAALELDLATELARVPEPVAHCAGCDFAAACESRWREADHLSLVANMRGDQRRKLARVGIDTVAALAASGEERVAGIGAATLPRLVTQARLQVEARSSADPRDTPIAYRPPAANEPAGRGFALLPEPDAADMFFDFEGYPYHDAGGLEYLWGWTSHAVPDSASATRFDYLWADTPAEEAAALTAFLDEVHARRARAPGMHVYHYAPYEITALRRLAHAHPHEQARLDQLLRAGVFVDLYAVVRQAMQIGVESYSIKQLEPLYDFTRTGDELADGGASIEYYEQWLLEGDPSIRTDIVDYNQRDCDSTLALRDWLLLHRDLAATGGIKWPARPRDVADDADPDDGPASEPGNDDEPHPTAVLVARLEAMADNDRYADEVRATARLLSAMPGWERRVRREFFGELFAKSIGAEGEDYLDEPAAVAGLELQCVETRPNGTAVRTYRFPDQVTIVKEGNAALCPISVRKVGEIEALDFDANTITIKTTKSVQAKLDASRWGDRPLEAVLGWADIRLHPLEVAARTVAETFADFVDSGRDPFAVDAPYAAVLSLLARRAPRVTPDVVALPPDPADLAQLIERSVGSHVIVQGPPGTGKTWTSARVIEALVDAGLTVGISSNSHAAIANVLDGIETLRVERARDGRPMPTLRAAYALKSKEKAPGELTFGADWIERPAKTARAAAARANGSVQVLAGSAWQFAREDVQVDVLLVDEAGQVSLLHAVAMGQAARRIVLVGDPQQLPQPGDTRHPHGCDASVLEHVFAGEAVLPPNRAVLLPQTRRMHPDVCSFISESYYEAKLHPHPDTATHRVDASTLPAHGLHLVRAPHVGNRTSSVEEVEAIRLIVDDLLAGGRVVHDAAHGARELRTDDILVVAPYNAQRTLLTRALPAGVAVGTVDKFQGQEAAVAILSLTASSREDVPRGLEFLLDPHRMNVAISRARALAIVVASPSLLATDASTVAEIRLLNQLARIDRVSSCQRTGAASSR